MPYYSPGYRVGCAFIFEFPDVFTEFGAVFLFFVFEGCFVSCVSGFEGGGCQSYVVLFVLGGGDFGFIDDPIYLK